MNIGIELPDNNISEVDLSEPCSGNPGVGGSEYLFVLLSYYLKKKLERNSKVFVFHYNKNKLPEGTKDIIVANDIDLIDNCEKYAIDILIHQVSKSNQWYKYLNTKSLRTIAWAHIYLAYEEKNNILYCDNVKRVVFVGKEEYDAYIDDDIINKSEWIYNMINASNTDIIRSPQYAKEVTYVGSLVSTKGFHVLAHVWKDILKQAPDAVLNVIGSGKIYDRNVELGEYGIAAKKYEDVFMPYLTDEAGKILPSVHLWGLLGKEKEEIFTRTAVGVVNPTALTETFCMSAVEMELHGIPVVSRKRWGLLDTIQNGETGYLFNNDQEFVKYVVQLLNNKSLNNKMGIKARQYVKDNFDADILINKWINLLKSVYKDEKSVYSRPLSNYGNDYKWARIIIRFFRVKLKLKMLPSLCTLKYFIKKVIKR